MISFAWALRFILEFLSDSYNNSFRFPAILTPSAFSPLHNSGAVEITPGAFSSVSLMSDAGEVANFEFIFIGC